MTELQPIAVTQKQQDRQQSKLFHGYPLFNRLIKDSRYGRAGGHNVGFCRQTPFWGAKKGIPEVVSETSNFYGPPFAFMLGFFSFELEWKPISRFQVSKKEVSLMFNRKNNVLLVLTLLIALGTASAATAGGSVFGGVNFPTGGFGDGAKTGWGLGGYYTADLMPIVDLGLLIAYNNFASDLDDLPELDELTDDSLNTWEFHALGQLSFGGMKGFLGLGLGSNSIYGVSSTDFSWQLGLAFPITKVEARLGYHQIPVGDSSMNWVNLSIGLLF